MDCNAEHSAFLYTGFMINATIHNTAGLNDALTGMTIWNYVKYYLIPMTCQCFNEIKPYSSDADFKSGVRR